MFDTSLLFSSAKEPAIKDPHFNESHASSYENRHYVRLKAPGTYLFITISDGQVALEVSNDGGNTARFGRYKIIYDFFIILAVLL